MAIKPTIFKFKIALSDLNRNYYDALNLTLAQHPSESIERMMVRLLAYCINAHELLSFTKGLSAQDEPDIWLRTLDDQITLWIDVGEPSTDRIKKASRLSDRVLIYSFNTKSDVWWQQSQNKLKTFKAEVFRFDWKDIQALAKLIKRTMDISITISENSAYFATDMGEQEINWLRLDEQ